MLCLKHGHWPRRLGDVEEIAIPVNKQEEIMAAQSDAGETRQ
ncbi:hypothetical protein [Halomonas sp. BC04]|nr:hypothetical protein [Halomonas sp. BC04]